MNSSATPTGYMKMRLVRRKPQAAIPAAVAVMIQKATVSGPLLLRRATLLQGSRASEPPRQAEITLAVLGLNRPLVSTTSGACRPISS
jgi:hypothetical protein